jgi:LuxR family transcriptional regulator
MKSEFFGQSPKPTETEDVSDAANDLSLFANKLAAIISAKDQETVWALTCAFFREIGFAHALYGYSPDSWGSKLGSPEDYLVMSTFDPAVSREMVDQNHYMQSLTFHWALQNVGVASWGMTVEESGLGADFDVSPASYGFFQQNGLMTGCSIGFPKEKTRGNAVFALIAPKEVRQHTVDSWLEQRKNVIFVVATVAHNRLSTLPYPTPRGGLTPRQREVLEWVAEGKTTADIATIIGLSSPTVDKHLRLARETLGVDTTAHALIKAAFLNQVFAARLPDSGVSVLKKAPEK